MSKSFSALKQGREDTMAALAGKLSEPEGGADRTPDDRFWKLTTDQTGSGSAVIRFLPASPGEDVPYVQKFNHFFKGPSGRYYVENSLTTIGQTDPVTEYNRVLWETGEEGKKQVREQKRQLSYFSNILVVRDPANRDNEGKVFLYRYGKKIFDKIKAAMNPEFEGDTKFNPFDLWEGADFKLRVKRVEGYPNYDSSVFDDPKALFDGDDDKLERLWNSQYKLQDLIAPSEFKTYAELEAKLYEVLGLRKDSADSYREPAPRAEAAPQRAAPARAAEPEAAATGEDEDDLAWFKNLKD